MMIYLIYFHDFELQGHFGIEKITLALSKNELTLTFEVMISKKSPHNNNCHHAMTCRLCKKNCTVHVWLYMVHCILSSLKTILFSSKAKTN